jgi:hypothetical protein
MGRNLLGDGITAIMQLKYTSKRSIAVIPADVNPATTDESSYGRFSVENSKGICNNRKQRFWYRGTLFEYRERRHER